MNFIFNTTKVLLALMIIIWLFSFIPIAHSAEIDMHKIMMIESSGDPLAHNVNSGARGLFQITKICLTEYNNFHPKHKFTSNDLWNPVKNTQVATWYLRQRIPQMLRYFKKPVSIRNIIISYNAGILYVVKNKPLPRETINYIKKYGEIK